MKTGIDAEVNNSIFRKDFPIVIAKRRDLAQISPVRLAYDAAGYLAGQCIARVTSTGIFGKWSAVSGSSVDTKCVLLDNVLSYEENSALTGGALSRAVFSGYVYKGVLGDYVAGSSLGSAAVEQTDASGVTVVKF